MGIDFNKFKLLWISVLQLEYVLVKNENKYWRSEQNKNGETHTTLFMFTEHSFTHSSTQWLPAGSTISTKPEREGELVLGM